MQPRTQMEMESAFYGGERVAELGFIVNDAVRLLDGAHRGRCGAVIAIHSPAPDLRFLVELEDGSDVVMEAGALELVEDESR